jgi:RNA polymerase sigma-70 factor (ECF subfamily)
MTDDPFGTSRKRLLGLAYRMLGSRAEAEDVLQDAWLRFNTVREIDNRYALLTTIVTRLCLDRLKSAQSRRETYVGPWLPEPIVDAEALATDAATELADDLSFALLLTLERLSSAERAAFLLHDVFDIPFAQVSAVLERNEATCRQLAARARRAVRRERPASRSSKETHLRLLAAFGVAAASGDLDALTRLFHEDAVLISDGGGKVMTARNPIHGADRIARFFAGVVRKFGSQIPGLRSELASINGMPGVVTWHADEVVRVLALNSNGDKITAVYVVSNPEKLRRMSV